jgi:S-adenosylmethionine:tRNA-ribosyltransferase-isomerase (queuine synthetase)
MKTCKQGQKVKNVKGKNAKGKSVEERFFKKHRAAIPYICHLPFAIYRCVRRADKTDEYRTVYREDRGVWAGNA